MVSNTTQVSRLRMAGYWISTGMLATESLPLTGRAGQVGDPRRIARATGLASRVEDQALESVPKSSRRRTPGRHAVPVFF